MKINLVNTASGFFIPETDEDYRNKLHLKVGETYCAEFRLVRNADFHRKYFKMIAVAWELIPETLQSYFRNSEGLRKYAEVAAGYCEPFFSPTRGEWLEVPKSIAFDKLGQAEFEDLYVNVRTVLDAIVTRYVSQEEFMRLLQF